MSKLVVVVQCDVVTKRCSGFPCMNSFYNRESTFVDYAEDTRYMMMTCGGCSGVGLAAKLENLCHKLAKNKIPKEEVIVHLASCIVSDNYHNPPCPHKKYLQEIVERKGFKCVLGTYISKKATEKRAEGIYKSFEE